MGNYYVYNSHCIYKALSDWGREGKDKDILVLRLGVFLHRLKYIYNRQIEIERVECRQIERQIDREREKEREREREREREKEREKRETNKKIDTIYTN